MQATPRERALSALASLAIVAGAVAALVAGLKPHWQAAVRSALTAVDIVAPPSPPPPRAKAPPPPPSARSAPAGEAGARNLKNRATPVFAPRAVPPLIAPPPITAAPVPALGTTASNGASTLPGPGQGAGASGEGLGGGGTGGTGTGGGLPVRGPRQIAGRLAYQDLPQDLIPPGREAGVEVRYTVNPDGTASHCRIDRSSGFPALDATACRLIEQRFRFRPARDRAGRPVPSTVAEEHVWVARDEE